MGRLRKELNQGGISHFTNRKGKLPFFPKKNSEGHYEWHECCHEKFDDMRNSPYFAGVVLMAFERALETGGWRVDWFLEWFEYHKLEFKVELVVAIESRLTPVIRKSNGHVMPEETYRKWYNFHEKLRRYLYGL